jgi:hypothetical protein
MTVRPPARPEDVTTVHLLAFLAEMALVVAFAWAGWLLGADTATSVVLAVLLPGVAIAVWGIWCAPRSARRLAQTSRWAVKSVLFAVAYVLLLVYGPQPGAALFGTIMVVLFGVSLPADRTSA